MRRRHRDVHQHPNMSHASPNWRHCRGVMNAAAMPVCRQGVIRQLSVFSPRTHDASGKGGASTPTGATHVLAALVSLPSVCSGTR